MKNCIVLIFTFVFLAFSTYSESLKIEMETYGIGSKNGNKPSHWLYSGKSGVFNSENEKVGTVLKLNGEIKKINFGTKLKISNSENENTLLIKEMYIEKDWKNWILYGGKKSYKKSNSEFELSTGKLLVSENAESPSRLYFGTNGYIPVPKTKEKLLFSASISHSKLEKERICKEPYLHEKEFYLKLKTGEKSSFYGGISHAARWGGEKDGKKINSSFDDFLSVLTLTNIGKNGIETEVTNKIGDHKGMHEFGYNFEKNNKDVAFYYQHFFEDSDGKRFQNYKDMLLGMNVKNKKREFINEMNIEYIYTKNQGGEMTHDKGGGQDYYYDNYLYGPWTYKDMIIGNSFFLTEGSKENLKISHSRIKGCHFGIKGKLLENLNYKTLVTYSKNYGTYADIGTDLFKNGKKQWYTYFEVEKNNLFNNENLSGIIGIGYDDGEIYNRAGIISSLKYTF